MPPLCDQVLFSPQSLSSEFETRGSRLEVRFEFTFVWSGNSYMYSVTLMSASIKLLAHNISNPVFKMSVFSLMY